MILKPREVKKILVFLIVISATSCAVKNYPYYDSAINDHNRAPSSVALPANENIKTEKTELVNTQARIDYLFLKSELAYQEGDNTEAISKLKEVIELHSYSGKNSDYLFYKLAQIYFKNNQVPDALVWIEKAVGMNPQNRDYNLLAGNLYSTNKQYANAEASYKKILSLNKEDHEANLFLGALYSEQKKYTQSVKNFTLLTKLSDYEQKYLAYYYLARTKYEWNYAKYEKEIKQNLEKSLKEKPEYLESLQFLGQLIEKTEGKKKVFSLYANHQKKYGPIPRLAEVLSQYYLEIGDYDNAFEQLEIVESQGQEQIQVKLKMALILIDKKMYDKALVRLEELHELVPESDKVSFYLGSIYQEQKKNEKAVAAFLTVASSSKHYSDARRNSVYLLKEMNRPAEGLKLATELVKQKPENIQNHILLSQLLEEEKNYDQALNILNQAALLFPKEAQVYYYLGSMYDKKQNKLEMFKNMHKAIELKPQFPLALNYIAYSLLETNTDMAKAEEYGLKAYSLDKNDPYIADTVGWIYFKKKEYLKAVKFLEQAHEQMPQVSVIAEHLADVYTQLNRFDKASEVYKKAIRHETDPDRIKALSIKQSSNQFKKNEMIRLPASLGFKDSNSLDSDVLDIDESK